MDQEPRSVQGTTDYLCSCPIPPGIAAPLFVMPAFFDGEDCFLPLMLDIPGVIFV